MPIRRPRFTAAAVGLAALSACDAGQPPWGVATVIYLNFSSGQESITFGKEDDASTNTSRLCEVSYLPAWLGGADCGSRDRCAREITQRVESLWQNYAVAFTRTRPPPVQDYSMVVIAPPTEECSFGLRGVAYLDCENLSTADVAFVADCQREVATCAVLVSHELGHTFGLAHTQNFRDIMFDDPSDPGLTFRDESAPVVGPSCGPGTQNSHQALLDRLGPRF